MPISVTELPSAKRRSWKAGSTGILIGILVFAEVVSAFESSMVYVAIPRLMEVFDASAAEVGWALTAFLLVTAASAVLGGRLGDLYGRKRVLTVVLAVSAFGSVISVLGDSLTMVIIGRGLQGVAGGIMPLCFGIARSHLAKNRVPLAVSLIAGSAMIAGAGGGVLAGLLIDHADWHWLFLCAAILATLATIGVAVFIPKNGEVASAGSIDYLGAILLPGGVAFALLAVTKGAAWGWVSASILGLFAASALTLVAWYVWQLRSDSPLFDVRLLRSRGLGLAYLITALLAVGVLGSVALIQPMILQTPESAPVGFGLSATTTGYIGALAALVGFGFAPISGYLCGRYGARLAVQAGAAVLVVGMLAIRIFMESFPGLILAFLVISIGVAFVYTALPNLVVENIENERTGEATGFATLLRATFNAVSAAVIGAILSANRVSGTPFSSREAYDLVIFLGIGASVIAAGLAMLIRARPVLD